MSDRIIHLVDDDEAVRRSASFMLKTSGYKVITYASGVDLLKDAKDMAPGCVLLDVRMPEMDGLQVQKELQERGIGFPVIVMTGHGDVGVAVQAMKAGAVDFIEKPFEKAVLLSAIEEGFSRLKQTGRSRARAEEARVRLQALTPRERDVLRAAGGACRRSASSARAPPAPRRASPHGAPDAPASSPRTHRPAGRRRPTDRA